MNEHGRPVWAGDDALMRDLGRQAYERCVPLSVSVEITLRCNIRCVHCYNFDRDHALPAASDAMEPEAWKRVFRELRDEGTLFLNITGGEAMSHPRFWEIFEEAGAQRFAITLLSNGTLLTDKACDRLVANPALAGVSLSLYGATAGTHDAITRSRGSWERTCRGAERMRDRGVLVHLKFILMKGNAHEAAAMLDLAASLGLPCQVDSTITGRYDGTTGSLAERADVATIAALYRGPLRKFLTKRKSEPTDDEFKCNCARTNCGIFSTGNVSPCIAVPLYAGNVRERSFREIWRESDFFRKIRALRLADFPKCAPCPLKAWCRRSPGPPSAREGDFTGVDPWVCEEAAAIREILG